MMSKIGHRFSTIISGVIFLILLSVWIDMPLSIRVIMSLLLAAVVLFGWAALRKHNRSLCEECLLPLQPEKDAEKYHRRLNTAHLCTDEPYYLIMYIASLAIVTSLVFSVPNFFTIILWEIGQLGLIYLLLSNSTHHRLQPWCPICRHGGSENLIEPDLHPVDAGV